MNCKTEHLPLMKSAKKNTLWNLSQLLGQQKVLHPQKVIEKKLLTSNLPRNTITPELDSKLQNSRKNTLKNPTKINFQFQRLKNSFQQHRSQIILKRSLTLNPKLSTQKLKNSLKNQFQTSDIYRSNSVHNIHIQKSYKSQQLSSDKTFISKIMNSRDSQLYIAIKYPLKQPRKSSLDLQQNLGFSPLLNPEKNVKANKKKSFLKKGTSLQKQIVVNLLKNKIMKEHEFETKRQYSTRQVLSMIKLYKGFHKEQGKNKQQNIVSKKQIRNKSEEKCQKKQFCPLNVVHKFKKPIQGWQIEPQIEIQ